MSPEEFAVKMRDIFPESGTDEESAHIAADSLLCEVLESLGYSAGVEVFRNADKWYA